MQLQYILIHIVHFVHNCFLKKNIFSSIHLHTMTFYSYKRKITTPFHITLCIHHINRIALIQLAKTSVRNRRHIPVHMMSIRNYRLRLFQRRTAAIGQFRLLPLRILIGHIVLTDVSIEYIAQALCVGGFVLFVVVAGWSLLDFIVARVVHEIEFLRKTECAVLFRRGQSGGGFRGGLAVTVVDEAVFGRVGTLTFSY